MISVYDAGERDIRCANCGEIVASVVKDYPSGYGLLRDGAAYEHRPYRSITQLAGGSLTETIVCPTCQCFMQVRL